MSKKETDVDAILAGAIGKMETKSPPTGNSGADMARVAGTSRPSTTASQIIETEVMRVTGPVDFAAMKAQGKTPAIIPAGQSIPIITNDDAKYGKAFHVAINTSKKFKITKVADFIELVNEIKNNL